MENLRRRGRLRTAVEGKVSRTESKLQYGKGKQYRQVFRGFEGRPTVGKLFTGGTRRGEEGHLFERSLAPHVLVFISNL